MIDTQQNIWGLGRGDYDGPNAEVTSTFRTFGQAKLAPLLVAAWLRQLVPVLTFNGQATT